MHVIPRSELFAESMFLDIIANTLSADSWHSTENQHVVVVTFCVRV